MVTWPEYWLLIGRQCKMNVLNISLYFRIAVNSVKKEKLAEVEAEEDVRVWSNLFRSDFTNQNTLDWDYSCIQENAESWCFELVSFLKYVKLYICSRLLFLKLEIWRNMLILSYFVHFHEIHSSCELPFFLSFFREIRLLFLKLEVWRNILIMSYFVHYERSACNPACCPGRWCW